MNCFHCHAELTRYELTPTSHTMNGVIIPFPRDGYGVLYDCPRCHKVTGYQPPQEPFHWSMNQYPRQAVL